MRKISLALIVTFLGWSCSKEKPRLLVFSKTAGYRHESIETGKLAILELGKQHGFDVDTTEDAQVFREENLKKYHAVVFLNTTQNVLDKYQQGDFKRFMEAGGGFVGIHAAADTEYEWPWYGKLVGAWFKSHPKIQEATLRKASPFGTDNLPDTWVRTDEWYNFKQFSDDIHVIYSLDESTYEGGENGADHPIAWYHAFEGGRSFYTGLGHTKESYSDSLFLDHLLQGIQYAIGPDPKLDYSKVRSERVVEGNRFSKVALDFNLNEPTEMTFLPGGRILFLERKGDVKLYDPSDGSVKVVNTFAVNTGFEDGMIGLTADPNFKENNWLYIFYSHPERSANVLSRFTFTGSAIDMSSERELLEVVTQRQQCCHTGGSLLFGPDGNLYISTGDNTNPFESQGYSPSDERPWRSPFDAQGSSANANDLRGKILRIRPQPDGTYTIPDGNLFPEGQAGTRPEIYVMGCRNPYRISIDEMTGYLYWGEVGPDSNVEDSLRGPRGYDEVNQAKNAGFFGWPLFVGNNYAYSKYNFASATAGAFWDPAKPLNTSPHNTGIQELPPANPAFIWYPYGKSSHFPMLKEGGRNAMAGPVYYSKNYKNVPTAFPSYFDGKLIIYDWIRNWIFLVSMDDEGNIMDIEPFMEDVQFNNIIDMAFGPDGALYMLEYGAVWFKQNIDARLVRIDYNGDNRPPVATLSANTLSGSVPLAVTFSAAASTDYDGDPLTYQLEVAGKRYTSADGVFEVTFDQPGVYKPDLMVADGKGGESHAVMQIIAGNEPPVVNASITKGNKTFFFPGSPVQYTIQVTDKEDGSTSDGGINPEDVTVTFDYLKSFDMTQLAQGHQKPVAELPGKALIARSDCKSCHLDDQESAGPAYKMIAARYATQKGAVDQLAVKIIRGGGGVWGEREMAGHPDIAVEDARKMAAYIISLGEQRIQKKLPLTGSVVPESNTGGAYFLTATYEDKSVTNLPSLSSSASVALRAPVLTVDQAALIYEARKSTAPDGQFYLDQIRHGSYIVFRNIDFTLVRELMPSLVQFGEVAGGKAVFRLDSVEGEEIGSIDFADAKKTALQPGVLVTTDKIRITPIDSFHDLYVVFINESAGERQLFYFSQILVNP